MPKLGDYICRLYTIPEDTSRKRRLDMLDGWVDVYLPDFKYWESEQALRYSKAEDYPETVKKAIREMYRQTGACRFDENGKIQKGVIVRHLLLPGELKAAKRIVQYLYETYGDSVYMSLMNQYTPLDTLDTVRYPELGRKVTEKEHDALVDYAIGLGVECCVYPGRRYSRRGVSSRHLRWRVYKVIKKGRYHSENCDVFLLKL